MHDHVIVPAPRHTWLWPVGAVAFVVGAIALGAYVDSDDSDVRAAAEFEHALGVEEGRRLASEELRPKIVSAYKHGRADAQREATAYCREFRP